MTPRVLKRAVTVALTTTVMAGAALATTAGTAAAITGGGCTGPASKQACVRTVDRNGSTHLVFAAAFDPVEGGPDCHVRMTAWDDTDGWPWVSEPRPCRTGHAFTFDLPNPTPGHVYRTELRIAPSRSDFEFPEIVTSPLLTY
ncbi:hypothetical protein ACFYZ9_17500 [Streptomyces sp. NPDC001691]|uniref:hypothetical protein n=1 Tax=unclassified Streptomyces TaxID=2593676 RepID=UPI001CB8BA0B|nr:hypothetical protein [Streptomyces sp. SDr-06]